MKRIVNFNKNSEIFILLITVCCAPEMIENALSVDTK